jgi:hypothetical protein
MGTVNFTLSTIVGIFSTVLAGTAIAEPDARCASRIGFYQPPTGIVSTPKNASRVAEIYLSSVYGSDQIKSQLPFDITAENGVWLVTGKLPRGFVGGVAEIEICQSNGLVLRIAHGK